MAGTGLLAGWIGTVAQEVHYAARGLCKAPTFTLVAVLTLALGIGGTATIFSLVDALLVRSLPYPEQDRLVALSTSYTKLPRARGQVSATDVAHWRADNRVFEQIEFVSWPDMVAMSSPGYAERVGVQHVSVKLFSLLGVKTFLGALPTDPVREKRGSQGVTISYEFWQHHFRGDPHVLGRPIFVDWDATYVEAVLNPGFNLFGTGVPEVYFIHGMSDPADSGVNDPRYMLAIAKLKPGVTLEQAQADMNVTALHLAKAFPAAYKDMGVKVEPLQKGLFGGLSEVFSLLFAVVGFVLLIACTNVANLLLVRGDGRRREMGVRLALGASRRAVIQQLLTESVLLSLAGGLAGLAFAIWGIRILATLFADLIPMARVAVNGRVLFFTFAMCVLTGLVFGMVPAYRASNNDPNECLREGGRSTASRPRHRTRNILVVAEIAVALVSLICAGLMINTVTRILHTSPGFDPDHLLTAEVRLTGEKYIDSKNVEKTGFNVIQPAVKILSRQILERVRGIPGVESAALVDWIPLANNAQHAFPGFTIVGHTTDPSAEKPAVLMDGVSAGYFQLMGIPIVRGRGIAEQDTETSEPVVVISEAMARHFWPNGDAIGQEIKFDFSPEERPRRVVGITGDVKQYVLTQETQPHAYVSYQQMPANTVPDWTESRLHKSLVIRTRSASPTLIASLRRTISLLAPDAAVFGVTTVDKTVANSARAWMVLTQILGLFAAMGLILAAIGIYGVISYSVSERSHELGLRMALGAQRGNVVALVLKQAMTLSILGVLIGATVSFAAAPLLAEFLYGVKPHDVLTLISVSSLLIAVSFLASYLPARRATLIDPMETLRHD